LGREPKRASLALARWRVEDAGVDADIGKGGQNEPPDAGVFIVLECGERWRKPNASVGREARTGRGPISTGVTFLLPPLC
jgi:hypothetical protein